MQEQIASKHDCDDVSRRAAPGLPAHGLLVGCCLFALLVGWIGTGRAAEPRGAQPLSPAVLTLTQRSVTVQVVPNPPSATEFRHAAPVPHGTTPVDVLPVDPAPPTAVVVVPDLAAKSEPLPGLPAPLVAQATPAVDMTMDTFLDRLMRAESGGRLTARSTTSSALGPFQFIDGTFLIVVRRHFAAETAALTPAQILALRTDLAFSRRAAEAFTRDNASLLVGASIPATFQNLRLAYLLGPGGAIKVLQTDPAMTLPTLLPANVIRANPFMRSLTVSGLVARAAREVAVQPTSLAGIVATPAAAGDVTVATTAAAIGGVTKVATAPRAPSIVVNCDLGLASCRKWLAMEQRRQGSRSRGVREAKLR
jgi:hypothetical protein